MVKVYAHSDFEDSARAEGYRLVAGIDEVGRGAVAGPVSLGMVILPVKFTEPVVDSKQLSPKVRTQKAQIIFDQAVFSQVVHIEAAYIDSHGIMSALREAGRQIIDQAVVKPDLILLDGSYNFLDSTIPVRTIVRGDQISVSIAAASIIAKCSRDSLMQEYAHQYPNYGFDTHVGYGTSNHRVAVQAHGLTPIHRKSFLKGWV